MSKSRTIIAFAIVLTTAMSGCGRRTTVQPMIISGTIKPVAMIVQAVAGTAFQVQILAGDNGTPLQNAEGLASKSAVVFRTGASIDAWSAAMDRGSARLVDLSAALDTGASGGPWLSFRDASDMARLVRDTLDAVYPDLKEQFDSRYAVFVDQCSQADGRLKRQVWTAGTRAFLAADTTWSMAAEDYGLRVVVQPDLKGLDLSGTDAAARVSDWGSREKTRVVVVDIMAGGSTGVSRQPNGIVVCHLDALGATAEGAFVPWLEGQLGLLGSAIGK
ncbi:MAG: metal ABC transporter solute-binding protein, Zn/Mn family [Candidatus Cryosericum sp.]